MQAVTTAKFGIHADKALDQVSREMSNCASTLYTDLKEVLFTLGNYTTNLYNLLGLLNVNPPTREKLNTFLTRHRVLENFLHQLLTEVYKFQNSLQQSPRKNDMGMMLLYESRLNGFYQDTTILEGALNRFDSDYNLFVSELDCALEEKN